jgi:hypothetical protein
MTRLAGIFRIAIMPLALCIVAGCQSRPGPKTVERELKMQPGAFAGFGRTALGAAVTFDNDIYSATCYPLFVVTGEGETINGPRTSGTILLWLHRVHLVSGRVFVETCDIEAPFEAFNGHVTGYLHDWWFEATLTDAPSSPRIALRRLAIDGWSEFSSPMFCGREVAFWSLEKTGQLSGHVVDLLEPAANQSASFGTIEIPGSDNGWGLPSPAWSADCTAATFKIESGATHSIRMAR